MSEPPSWTAPGTGGQQPVPPHGAPQKAPQPPGSGGWGQPAAAPGGAWAAAAPRPGIIPLRPLSLGELWDGAFRAVRSNPKPLLGFSAVVVVIITAASMVLSGILQGRVLSLEQDPTASPEQVLSAFGADAPGARRRLPAHHRAEPGGHGGAHGRGHGLRQHRGAGAPHPGS
ncbi:MAG: hypothetical protein PGN11_07640 [Quadrisphaera sp.]